MTGSPSANERLVAICKEFCCGNHAASEIDRLRLEVATWKADAQNYMKSATHWRKQVEEARTDTNDSPSSKQALPVQCAPYFAALVRYIDGFYAVAMEHGISAPVALHHVQHAHSAVVGLQKLVAADELPAVRAASNELVCQHDMFVTDTSLRMRVAEHVVIFHCACCQFTTSWPMKADEPSTTVANPDVLSRLRRWWNGDYREIDLQKLIGDAISQIERASQPPSAALVDAFRAGAHYGDTDDYDPLDLAEEARAYAMSVETKETPYVMKPSEEAAMFKAVTKRSMAGADETTAATKPASRPASPPSLASVIDDSQCRIERWPPRREGSDGDC